MDQLIAIDAMHRLNCIVESGLYPCTLQNNITQTNETKLLKICISIHVWMCVCVCASVLG